MTEFDTYMMRPKLERAEDWNRWIREIPAIKFKSDWEVRVIPPFAGAIARFHIDKGDKHVSVYLDCYDKLGCVGEPYWEIYPYEEDTARVLMNDIDELLKLLSEVLD